MHSSTLIITLALAVAASARPARFGRRASFDLANGQAAIALNDQFKTLTASSACTEGQDACVGTAFAQCVSGKFVLQPCAATTICAALPNVNSAGTSITCTTQADLDARIAATGATSGDASSVAAPPPASTTAAAPPPAATTAAPPATNNAGGGAAASDPTGLQTSLTLDASVINSGYNDNGQNPAVAGQTASQTSTNNYINYCALTLDKFPLTNGLQITSGSCNQAPMGLIPSVDKMVSCKFSNPKNGDTIPANVAFNATLNILNLSAGLFTNAQKTYYAAPQQLDENGIIKGHSHFVIEPLTALDQTTPNDPRKFTFFKGIDTAAVDGALSVTVANGVPAGFYRICSINSSTNHQPVLAPVAQHGSMDDCSYFTAK